MAIAPKTRNGFAMRYFLIPAGDLNTPVKHIDKPRENIIKKVITNWNNDSDRRGKLVLEFDTDYLDSNYVFGEASRFTTRPDYQDAIELRNLRKELGTRGSDHEGILYRMRDLQNKSRISSPRKMWGFSFILDIKNQLVATYRYSGDHEFDNYFVDHLSELFSSKTMKFGYVSKFEYITDEQGFWSVIQSNTISKIDLTLNSPNSLNSKSSTEDAFKILSEECNNTSIRVELSNEAGLLYILPEQWGKFVRNIALGGGRWKVTLQDKSENYSSYQFKRTIWFNDHDIGDHVALISKSKELIDIIRS